MVNPHRYLERHAGADEAFAQHLLFDAAWRFAWKALRRYRLDDADRKDVAQNVVIAAWRGRDRYRAERGNPEQWLSGIVSNVAAAFLRNNGRALLVCAGSDLPAAPSETSTPEKHRSLRDLADLVFAVLPEEERRAVIAIAIEGLTVREAAVQEGSSPSTIYARYKRGIAALRAAAERSKDVAVFALPLFDEWRDFHGPEGDSEPPPEYLGEAWERAVEELGLDRDSDPFPSGPRRKEPQRGAEDEVPASRRRERYRKLGRFLRPIGGGVIGALLMLDARESQQETALPGGERAVVIAAAPTPSGPGMVTNQVPALARTGAPAAVTKAATLASIPPAKAPVYRDAFDAERSMADRGRNALFDGDIDAALAALDELERKFPHGQNIAMRAHLLRLACARAATDPRCHRPHP